MVYYDIEFSYPHSKLIKEEENKRSWEDKLGKQINKAIENAGSYDKDIWNCGVYYLKADRLKIAIKYEPQKIKLEEILKIAKQSIKKKTAIKYKDLNISDVEEITTEQFQKRMEEGDHNSFLDYYGNSFDLLNNRYCKIREKVITKEKLNKASAIIQAKRVLADKTLLDEINRIYDKKGPKEFYGFPINYNIQANDLETALQIVELILQLLNSKNRLYGTRYTLISSITNYCYDEAAFEKIFKSSEGLAIVIDCQMEENLMGKYANGYDRVVTYISKLTEKYRSKCLFFFIENTKNLGFTKPLVNEAGKYIDIINIAEGCGNKTQAISYFKSLIDDSPYSDFLDEKIEDYLPKDRNIFKSGEVYESFDAWSKDALRNKVYPAYSKCNILKSTNNKDFSGDAYDRLQKMVGLSDIKCLVDKVIATYNIMNYRDLMGINTYDVSRHMVFTGNPGSAKTTVARLLADILTEKGILDTGAFVECGRGDLVGRYVGWTAPLVQRKFQEAKGGILFIDEAYSLVDGRDGLYGDEAINTIVQEMENYRGDVIVIFAGYPEKMKTFIQKNEGLRSRIAFYLDFPDYNPQELLDIMKLMLDDRSLITDTSIDKKCLKIFEAASNIPDFGNGRFVRNLVEDAMLNQAQRLVQTKENGFTDLELKKLEAEDFDEGITEHLGTNSLNRKIGFYV